MFPQKLAMNFFIYKRSDLPYEITETVVKNNVLHLKKKRSIIVSLK